jgi:uncharacterized membrane protein
LAKPGHCPESIYTKERSVVKYLISVVSVVIAAFAAGIATGVLGYLMDMSGKGIEEANAIAESAGIVAFFLIYGITHWILSKMSKERGT